MKPLAGYVLLEKVDVENKTASGLELPDSVKEQPLIGKVIATGQKVIIDIMTATGQGSGQFYVLKCPVKEGDTVVYRKYSDQEIKAKGKDYSLVKFNDLMAVMEEK